MNMQGLQLTGYPATGTPPTIQQGANPTNIFDSEYPDGSENYHHGVDADQPEFQ